MSLLLTALLHWLRSVRVGRLFATVAISFAMAVGSQYPEYRGVFASVQGMVTNLYLASKSEAARADVVTVAIDDDDYQRFFNGTSPLNPAAVMGLVEALRALEPAPAVIGVDILTEGEEYREWPNRAAKGGVPVVWAASGRYASEPVGFFPWLFGASEELIVIPDKVLGLPVSRSTRDWGMPVFPADDDRNLRRLPRSWLNRNESDSRFDNTLARVVAERYCWPQGCHDHGDAGEVLLTYGSRVPEPRYMVRDLFTCEAWKIPADKSRICEQWGLNSAEAAAKERELLDGKVVLLGGVFGAARDFYPTPGGESTSGLMINALAVRTEIDGPTIVESSRLLGVGFDFATGLLVGFIFARPRRSLRWKTWSSLALVVPAFGLSVLLFWLGNTLWLSWVVMLVSSAGWGIVQENIRHGKHRETVEPAGRRMTTTRVTVERTSVEVGADEGSEPHA
jgi:CHASE2 domain-containing sensor protein